MDFSKAILVLDAIAPIAKLVPVAGDGLETMLETAKRICQAVEVRLPGARVSHEEYRQIVVEVAGYANAVSKALQSDSRFSPRSEDAPSQERESLTAAVRQFTDVLDEVLELVEKKNERDARRLGKRFGKLRQIRYEAWHKDDDAEVVKGLRKKMETNAKFFNIGNDVRGLEALGRIENDMKTISATQRAHAAAQEERAAAQETQLERVEIKINEVVAGQPLAHVLLKRELEPILSARFDWHGKPEGCLPQTRIKLLHQLRTWITNDSPTSPSLFVLTGLAGTGKTTVAQSVCVEFDRERTTISFFVSRSFSERRNPENVVRTIAYQLAARHPAVRSAVREALRNGRDVVTRPLAEQVETLILVPLQALGDPTSHVLLVIDALDECDKVAGREGGELIPLLVSAIHQLSGRAKLLVTSREEPEIMRMLKELRLNTQESLVRLQNIEDAVVKEDIRAFFVHHFRLISESRRFKDIEAWPSEEDLDLLVELTGKLFVYAAILVRVVGAPRVDPKKRLEGIIRPISSSSSNSPTFQALDALYLDVLIKSISTGDDATGEEVVGRVRKVVGTLVLLQSPLSVTALSELLRENPFLVQEDVDHLSAVLLVPDNPSDSVTIFHPSFRDYILLRCTDERFRIDVGDYNGFLAHYCLDAMNRYLKRDICNIQDPSVMNENIDDLEERLNKHMPLELRYACQYWAVHVSNASHASEALTRHLTAYSRGHLLHWLEALSLLGNLTAAPTHLPLVIEWCKRHLGSDDSRITPLLEDVERLVLAYDIPIRAAALQVYCSGLIFIPSCGLYEIEGRNIIGTTQLLSERLSRWPASRRTLEGHSSAVTSVAYSPDGTQIVSGSGDNTVRVWDAVTGRQVTQLNGHTGWVLSVAFSPDGTRIVSGSDDRTVRLWDAVTGEELAQLLSHSDAVRSTTFSPGGTHIASGSFDKTVRVWDALTYEEIARFHGHTDQVSSVTFSPDGTRIASSSRDKTVRVWDVMTGLQLVHIDVHVCSVASVAFSSDGTRIASNSGDKTVRVWDAVTGRQVAQIDGHTGLVLCVAFSPDGKQIASGSDDKTVRLWDIATGRQLAQLHGHTGWVWYVAFSPDGTRVASGSRDKTVRVWDVVTGREFGQLDGHTDWVMFVVCSPDGKRIASGSRDQTVRVWDVFTGRNIAQLNGHTGLVWSVEFSENGSQIISTDTNNNRRVWHAGIDFPKSGPHPHPIPYKSQIGRLPRTFSFDGKTGWLSESSLQGSRPKRLCWIPSERRGRRWTFDNVVVLSSRTGILTILSVSK